MAEHPSYYAVLTARVRYDNRLSASEKILAAEISALSNKAGHCFATNAYFARLYDVSARRVSTWVSNLQKYGHIRVEQSKGKGRKIYSILDPNHEENFLVNHEENFLHNITSTNSEAKKPPASPAIKPLIVYYADRYQERTKTKATVNWGAWGKNIKELLGTHTPEEVQKVIDFFMEYRERTDFSFYTFRKKFDTLAPRALSSFKKPDAIPEAGHKECPACGKTVLTSGGICMGCGLSVSAFGNEIEVAKHKEIMR